MPDDHSKLVPLLPIPNRTVKRLCADDSAGSRVKVGHRQALTAQKTPVRYDWGFLLWKGGSQSPLSLHLLQLLAMQLQDILYSQGFGTRRVCAGLIQQGWVSVCKASSPDADYGLCTEATADFEPEGLLLRVQGVGWPFQAKAYVLLHKPAGTECSQKPSTYPSIYTLLPPPLRQRPTKSAVQGVQAVGRLDQDTTGMLLLSDDGQFIHRLSSPKKHVPKVYQVTTKHPVDEAQVLTNTF